ncbi:hypothetical protein M758_12G044900 [Ceratodon purpureus]|nr:hypothetical protein M758_12G044900 [Ceratodon purpureus]
MLDNVRPLCISPSDLYPLAPCANEVGVRGALETLLFPAVEMLVAQLDIPFASRSDGSGRSYSYTDMVILDKSFPQGTGERMELSHRVYGNGEAKDPWQWEDAKKAAKTVETMQQLYMDMILDESKYGFISNYNQTIFFRRADDVKDKTLEFSPTIEMAHRAVKHRLPRASVPFTLKWGYTLTLPRVTSTSAQGRKRMHSESTIVLEAGGKRARTGTKRFFEVELSDFSVDFYSSDIFNSLPDYKLEDLGLTGRVVGLGTYGNVLEGVLGGCLPAAVKLFDFRIKGPRDAFVAEQQGYKYLKPLQGKCVPILYAVGSMAHYNMAFMALSDEGTSKFGTSPLTRSLKKQVLEALDGIHNLGVLHNDVKLDHVLISQGAPKFIDFQGSSTSESDDDFQAEQNFMRVLLEDF